MSETLMKDQLDIMKFLLAGNSTFTIKSKKTNKHFTYKVKRAPKSDSLYFTSILTGPDNWNDYQYIGTIFSKHGLAPPNFKHGLKSKIGNTAPSVSAIRWFINNALNHKENFKKIEFYHSGKCGKCGRKLTDPESITIGLGPICRGKS